MIRQDTFCYVIWQQNKMNKDTTPTPRKDIFSYKGHDDIINYTTVMFHHQMVFEVYQAELNHLVVLVKKKMHDKAGFDVIFTNIDWMKKICIQSDGEIIPFTEKCVELSNRGLGVIPLRDNAQQQVTENRDLLWDCISITFGIDPATQPSWAIDIGTQIISRDQVV